MKRYAIIVAGGKGERMSSDLPKQFIQLRGIPLLMHTIKVFYDYDSFIQLIIVLPANQISLWKKLCNEHSFAIPHEIVQGGETRFASVKNGLVAIKEKCIIAVHDGVRPLVNRQTLENCYSTAEHYGTAVPVFAIVDSLRKTENNTNFAVERNQYCTVQTPQVFQSSILKIAYNQTYEERFTDDATVVESLGIELNLVEGNRDNIKVTTPPDLKIAEVLLSEREAITS
ncbi:MAG: 2-C-methyl-D-erythritol 4-phosphate cytidylyltransferase [Bacteroidota bacterium]|nr:2-C-methyl-D-erythritol 4-phosphate cytidylyltransferase [Bacteroidota bacterium]